MNTSPPLTGSLVGLWVEVPTGTPKRCLAHVVRQNGPLLFVYYFAASDDFDMQAAEAGDAFFAEATGYLGIRGGEWPVIGKTTVARTAWPIIEHSRGFPSRDGGVSYSAVRLAEDIDTELGRRPIAAEEAALLPQYGSTAGHKAAEAGVTAMISAGLPPMKTQPFWTHQLDQVPEADPCAHSRAPLPFGVRVVISEPWTGNLDKLLRRLRRAVPRGDEVDGWELGPTTSVYLYGRELGRLVDTARRAGRAAGLPQNTHIVGTDADFEEILREPLW